MWTDRNDTLHKNENIVKEEENRQVNRSVVDIYDSMPSNMRILTATEQQFFKGATSKEVQWRKLGRKKQWLKKANSILAALWKRAENDPAVRMMYLAIGLSMNITAQGEPELYVHQKRESVHCCLRSEFSSSKILLAYWCSLKPFGHPV